MRKSSGAWLVLVLAGVATTAGCGLFPSRYAIAPGQSELLGPGTQRGAIARELYVVSANAGLEQSERVLDIDIQRSADDAKFEGGHWFEYRPGHPSRIEAHPPREGKHAATPTNFVLIAKQLIDEQGLLGESAPEGSELSLAFGVNWNEANAFQTFMNGLGIFLWGTTGDTSYAVVAVLRRKGDREIVVGTQHVQAEYASGILSWTTSVSPPYERVVPDQIPDVLGADLHWFNGKLGYMMARKAIEQLRREAGLPTGE